MLPPFVAEPWFSPASKVMSPPPNREALVDNKIEPDIPLADGFVTSLILPDFPV